MQGVTKPARLYRRDGNLWSIHPKADGSAVGTSADAVASDPISGPGDGPTGPEEATSSESAEPGFTHAGMLNTLFVVCVLGQKG